MSESKVKDILEDAGFAIMSMSDSGLLDMDDAIRVLTEAVLSAFDRGIKEAAPLACKPLPFDSFGEDIEVETREVLREDGTIERMHFPKPKKISADRYLEEERAIKAMEVYEEIKKAEAEKYYGLNHDYGYKIKK